MCADVCVQLNGEPLLITKDGTLTLHVTARGVEKTIEITDVYFAKDVKHNLISYGVFDIRYTNSMKRGPACNCAGRRRCYCF